MSKENKISVVIPTCNRESALKKLLKLLQKQTLSKEIFEVIVVDDGASNDTKKVIGSADVDYKITYARQNKQGPASARNSGILKSKNNLIVFLDDDTEPLPTCLEEHISMHKSHKQNHKRIAVLGNILLPGSFNPYDYSKYPYNLWPFLDYFHEYRHRQKMPWFKFLACNISIKRKDLIKAGMFNIRFPYPAQEDLELGYRLQKRGVNLIFNKNAKAHHFNYKDFEARCEERFRDGCSKAIFMELHPELEGFLKRSQQRHKIRSHSHITKLQNNILLIPKLSNKQLHLLKKVVKKLGNKFKKELDFNARKEFLEQGSKLFEYIEAEGMRKGMEKVKKK